MATKAQSLYDKVNTGKRQTSALRFPDDVAEDATGNIIRFNISLPEGSKYLADGTYRRSVDPKTGASQTSVYRQPNSNSLARKFSDNYTRITTTIDMYMPPQIQSNYSSDWNMGELGTTGAMTDAFTSIGDLTSMGNWERIWGIAKNTIPEALLNTATGTIEALTPIKAQSVKKLITNTTSNPYAEVLFNGMKNRTFSFTFKMIPRNAKEQATVKKIVDEFKFHMHPEVKYQNQNNYFIFPSEFDIKFIHRGGENPWLYKISTCALTDVQVNHSPEGNYASHADGSPFAVELTLNFTELEYMTKSRIKQGY